MKSITKIQLDQSDMRPFAELVDQALRTETSNLSDDKVWNNFMQEAEGIAKHLADISFNLGFETAEKMAKK